MAIYITQYENDILFLILRILNGLLILWITYISFHTWWKLSQLIPVIHALVHQLVLVSSCSQCRSLISFCMRHPDHIKRCHISVPAFPFTVQLYIFIVHIYSYTTIFKTEFVLFSIVYFFLYDLNGISKNILLCELVFWDWIISSYLIWINQHFLLSFSEEAVLSLRLYLSTWKRTKDKGQRERKNGCNCMERVHAILGKVSFDNHGNHNW